MFDNNEWGEEIEGSRERERELWMNERAKNYQ